MVAVVLLTKAECENCVHAKEILDQLARELTFTIDCIDLDTVVGQHLAEANGVIFAPGVLIDGRLSSYGRPSQRRLRRDLESASRGEQR